MRHCLEGVVVHWRSTRAPHRLYRALTAEQGTLTLHAAGAERSMRRFGGLDLFCDATLEIDERRDLWALKECSVDRPRLEIRTDYQRILSASLLCEIATVLAPEGAESRGVFLALRAGLDAIVLGESHTEAYRHMLRAAGILPSSVAFLRDGATPGWEALIADWVMQQTGVRLMGSGLNTLHFPRAV